MSSTVRWGILSTAHINRAFLGGAALCADCRVHAVSSREWTRANEYAKEHGIPRAFGSYEELLRSGEVDAIYNPLPNSMHCEWTIRALEAGLHVLCEKPFAVTADEARQMAEASKRTGKLLAEAFMYRYHPIYDRILETIKAGGIGQIVAIRVTQNFLMRDWATNIRASGELAGGATMDVGCYCINFCRRILGEEPARAFAFERRGNVDNTLSGSLEFPGGAIAQFQVSMETNGYARAEIMGTAGLILMDQPFFPGYNDTQFTLRRGTEDEVVTVPGANCYAMEIQDFAEAMRSNRPTRWPVDDAIKNMAVIDACYQAAKEGRAVAVER
ncbi:MAG: Gfo/Idh/MocA family oxidoreductase [FCB group bacterium]|jgi:predicted dehydrogenase|nr:Gfo/Idh/MocA family oxidoreductase [FCB group bacterium]